MASRTTIEINGKKYDAITGEALDQPKNKPEASKLTPKPQTRFIDGVRGPVGKTVKKPNAPKPVVAQTKQPADAKKAAVKTATAVQPAKSARAAAPVIKRKLKKSQTLHRRSVKRPTTVKEKTTAVSRPIKRTEETKSKIDRKTDSGRLDKAKQVRRSDHISRFGSSNYPAKAAKETTIRPQQLHQHVAAAREVSKKRSEPTANIHRVTPVAAAHRTKKRFAGVATTLLAIIILGGYVAYLNVPGISMKVAGHRAGFAAALPKAPAGYSLAGPITSSSGLVTVNFKSNVDQRHFSLRQQPSNWDSQALLENEVSKAHADYITYQDRGLTIYVYDGSNASWINGGKLFSLKSDDAQLTVDQILSVAASM